MSELSSELLADVSLWLDNYVPWEYIKDALLGRSDIAAINAKIRQNYAMSGKSAEYISTVGRVLTAPLVHSFAFVSCDGKPLEGTTVYQVNCRRLVQMYLRECESTVRSSELDEAMLAACKASMHVS